MRYLKLFEYFDETDSVEKWQEIVNHFKSNIDKVSLPFTESEYYIEYQKLDDYWGLEADVDASTKYQTSYLSYREVASGFDKLKLIKVVSDNLDKSNINFCDLGCGLGNIVMFAKKMGFNSIGVEYQERLKQAHDSIGINVKYGDFFKMNLTFLKKQDIIYLYRPIDDIEGVNKLLKLLFENTRNDVVIIYNSLDNKASLSGFNKVTYDIEGDYTTCLLVK